MSVLPLLCIGSIATMDTTELELHNASKAGDVSKVKAVLTATPTVDVNKQNPDDVRDDCVMQTAAADTLKVWWRRATTQP